LFLLLSIALLFGFLTLPPQNVALSELL
jgi:hypothetical protein